jgi:putative FmdB family regulatory protein
MFEYICKDCGRRFEKLVQAMTVVECPSCKGEKLEKQLSVFALGKAKGSLDRTPAVMPCGACGDPRGPGSCSSN